MTDPLFTKEQVAADGRSRVVNTGGQVGAAVAIVGLASSFCRWRGWLNGNLDPIGFGYWVTVATTAAAALTNLSKLRGKQ